MIRAGPSMTVRWKTKNKKFKPEIVLDLYKKSVKVSPEGRIGFDLRKFDYDTLLFTMLEFDENYCSHNAQEFAREAIMTCAYNGDFSKDFFLVSLRNEIKRHLGVPEELYVLSSSISVKAGFPIGRIEIDGAIVESFPSGFPDDFKTREVFNDRWQFADPPLCDDHCPVLVTVKNKHWRDAFEKALDTLDFVRGVFCLIFNPKAQLSLGERFGAYAGNKIALGGMHCLHRVDGSLAVDDTYWYERGYKKAKALLVTDKQFLGAALDFDSIVDGIDNHPDSSLLKKSVLRYVRALDSVDKNSTVLQLWTALESLAGRGGSGPDGIVQRCSFLYEEREYHCQVLEHLREYRNANVHSGVALDSPDWHCLQLQGYLRDILRFYIFNDFAGATVDDANRFLDLSTSKDRLNREIIMRENALKFLGYESSSDAVNNSEDKPSEELPTEF